MTGSSRRTTSVVVLLALAAGAGAASAASPDRSSLKVHAPVPVTAASPFDPRCSVPYDEHVGAETEVSLAVDPVDPRVLVASWMQDATVAHPVARSTDGGRTWRTVVVAGASPCTDDDDHVQAVFDPWVSYGGDGRLYLSSASGAERSVAGEAAGTYDPFARHVYVNVSRDGGKTWTAAAVAGGDVDDGFVIDKPTLTADPTRPGHAYATWSRIQLAAGAPVLGFSRTQDGGATWQERLLPVTGISGQGSLGGSVLSEVEVLPDGELLLISGDVLPQPLLLPSGVPSIVLGADPTGTDPFVGPMRYQALRSKDGGGTWELASSLIGQGRSVPEAPASAVAPDGRVYVAWVDRGASQSSLVVARSDDAGRTWSSAPLAAAQGDVSVANLAVDRTGSVAVTWYAGKGATLRPWIALSRDRAKTWDEAPLTEAFDASAAPLRNAAGGSAMGDYGGLVGLRRGFMTVVAVAGRLATSGPTDLVAVRVTPRS